jgi:hypothetical protein
MSGACLVRWDKVLIPNPLYCLILANGELLLRFKQLHSYLTRLMLTDEK